ncbi:hypothetical protein R1flu_005168 [Riccia fluitans]|uniref:Uncharacterized protein n=1 Tax=Riccia fluitans TaxID=41844 RepID=A0ABD1YTC5_9MARC
MPEALLPSTYLLLPSCTPYLEVVVFLDDLFIPPVWDNCWSVQLESLGHFDGQSEVGDGFVVGAVNDRVKFFFC